ncbi:MarR family winged helix-turn-helix transcriptional regulator [Nonomuraea basaltis]|uniref:MarR family winged helix-turn-helix transcriptional regulator n=1 Tax=Nonomuraea basaltis TaxID=2495887 RepID=UPI00110C4394|nr:MarR family transcriptional regulator [Nonomuraea basaltis]TMR92622.1 MarR family transcriptional regulator [Nonomuraea basaltis]
MDDEKLRATAVSLRRAAIGLARRLRDERPTQGPGQLGLSLLGHLYRHGEMTAGELAAAEHLQPQSVTRVLAELETRELIRRSRDSSDRRRHHIVLTEPGRAMLVERVRESDLSLAEAMSRSLTPAECRILSVAADLIDQLLDGKRPRQVRAQ